MNHLDERRVHAFSVIHDRQEVLVVRGLTYLGMKFPPENVIDAVEEIVNNPEPLPSNKDNYRTACLRSDTGIYIWGLECWWGDSNRFENTINDMGKLGAIIRVVTAEEFRHLLNRYVYQRRKEVEVGGHDHGRSV